jgi:uncharacterized protein (DUF983 family)
MDVRCVCGWLRPTPYHAGEYSFCPACGRPIAPAGAAVRSSAVAAAVALAGLALLTVTPAIWVLGEALTRSPNHATPATLVPAWVHWSIFAGVVELAFAVLVAQVPHWISLRGAATMTLLMAAAHATFLGGTLMGGVWAHRVLQIATPLPTQQGPHVSGAAAWNLLLLILAVSTSVWLAWRGQLARCEASEAVPQA